MRFVPLVMLLTACSASPFSCEPIDFRDDYDLARSCSWGYENGSSCGRDSQCCSQACGYRQGASMSTCCAPRGARCYQPLFGPDSCCTGYCSSSNGTCVACSGRGKSCVTFSECCSGNCDNGNCACSVSACDFDDDCCSRVCDRHRCLARDLAVPIDLSRPPDLAGVD